MISNNPYVKYSIYFFYFFIVLFIALFIWNYFYLLFYYKTTPVDLVYLWVDSNDAAWKQKQTEFKKKYAEHSGEQYRSLPYDAVTDSHFEQMDELYFSILSVRKYANWVRKIFIVVDEQKPIWFDALKEIVPKIELVDIRQIMDPSYIPCYNSIAIETNLYKIPGLAEYFIYSNDDMFIGDTINKSDLIMSDGKVAVIPHSEKFAKRYKNMSAHKYHLLNMQKMLDLEFGEKERQRIQHVPLVLRKSVYEEIVAKFPDEVARNHTPFRDKINFHVHYFVQWYMIETNRAIWKHMPNVVIYPSKEKEDMTKYFANIQKRKYKWICLNNMENAEKNRMIREFLDQWKNDLLQ